MEREPNLRLTLSSQPENVLVVRQALTGTADAFALSTVQSNDLYTAVTEACNNVVMFAYDGANEGPLEVEIRTAPGRLTASVADRGTGIGETSEGGVEASEEAGIGLHLIRAVADDVQMLSRPGGGTNVVMGFDFPSLRELEPVADASSGGSESLPLDAVRIELTPDVIVPLVLPRTLTALAVGARFTIDQLANIERLGRALANCARGAGCIALTVKASTRALKLHVSPCRAVADASSTIAAGLEEGLLVEPLNQQDGSIVATGGGGETLALHVSQALVS